MRFIKFDNMLVNIDFIGTIHHRINLTKESKDAKLEVTGYSIFCCLKSHLEFQFEHNDGLTRTARFIHLEEFYDLDEKEKFEDRVQELTDLLTGDE